MFGWPKPLDWVRDRDSWPHREHSRFVEAAGLRWHVQDFPAAPESGAAAASILLMHGTGASTHSWRDLAPALASQARVVAIDLPGHGFTERPNAARLSLQGVAASVGALLETLALAPTLLVGHSAGAAIATRLALDGAARPRAIVSFAGAFKPFDGIAGAVFPAMAKALVLNPFTPRLFATMARQPGRVEGVLRGAGSRLSREGVAYYERLLASPGHVAGALGMMASWSLEPLLRDLPRLPCRLVLVVGEHDRATPPEDARAVAALAPEAEIVTFPACGHLLHEEEPERAVAVLTAELARARAAVATS